MAADRPAQTMPPKNASQTAPTLVERVASGEIATVVTATAPLARELQRQFDRHQRAHGEHAWESADALPYADWLARLWRSGDDINAAAAPRPLLLGAVQLAALWEAIIGDDIADAGAAPLWNVPATAKTAIDAWRALNDWDIELAACAASPHEDHRRWHRWARQFQQRCGAQGWVDSHSLAPRLRARLEHADAAPAAGKILWLGFDQLLPQQQALFDGLTRRGADLELAPPPAARRAPPQLREYDDESSQWLAAARWARAKLLDDPAARIAIVAANVDRAAAALEYALKQILSPQQLLVPGVSAALPYHISTGKNLLDYAVVGAAALALTALREQALPSATIGALLGSPFIRGAETEAAARSQLDVWRRQKLPYQVTLRDFAKNLPRASAAPSAPKPAAESTAESAAEPVRRGPPPCPILRRTLETAVANLPRDSAAKAASHWAQCFAQWLKHLGWPGQRALDSDEFQAAEAFRRALRDFATAELTSAPMGLGDALSRLQRLLAERPFQPKSSAAPVQVLGLLEAAGQRFDALWFGGLVESDWPPAQHMNPFISAAVQHAAGVTEADLTRLRGRAEGRQQRLLAAADEVVLSRPKMVDNIAAEPSPLLAACAAVQIDAAEAASAEAAAEARFPTPAQLVHAAKPRLEAWQDRRGPAHPPGPARGGASLVENQAKCPFRAFATHRLGARQVDENEPGLGPMERGGLFHHALQIIWEGLKTSQNLRAQSADERDQMVTAAAAQAATRYRFISGCGEKFHQTLVTSVAETVTEWLQGELDREGEFTAISMEEKLELNLAGLELELKIDRIDESARGKLTLIDYKTGQPDKSPAWVGARPTAVQLPLYALAQTAPVAALAYGRVKKGECGFSGLAENAEAAPGGVAALDKSPIKDDFPSWADLLAHWRATLPALAAEFLAGEARVDPAINACQYCALPGLCRVGEAEDAARTAAAEAAPSASESTPPAGH